MSTGLLSKRDHVRTHLLRELASGKYRHGALFPSENAVIKTLGVSKTTVREAYSSLVGDGLLERIRGKGTFVRRLGVAESGGQATRQVHLVIGDPRHNHEYDPFAGSVLAGLHEALDPLEWRIKLTYVEQIGDIPGLARQIGEILLDGENVILAGFDFPAILTDPLAARGIRLLTIGRPESASVPFVHTDHRRGLRETTIRLIDRGHTRIALVDRRAGHASSFEERRAGFIQGMDERGLVPDARLMVEYNAFDAVCGEEVWCRLSTVNVPYTAIILYGDLATQGYLSHAAADGIRIPADVSVVSVCNTPLVSGKSSVTRLSLCPAALGRAAGGLLVAPSVAVMIPPRLIDGQTLGAPPIQSVPMAFGAP